MLSSMMSDSTLRRRGSYANPHATIAMRDIPTNIKQIMRLCHFYYHTDAILGGIIDKMAEYPITSLLIKSVGEESLTTEARDKWTHLLETTLNVRAVLRIQAVSRYVRGISVSYLYYPFVRYATCTTCGKEVPLRTLPDPLRPYLSAGAATFSFTVNAKCPQCQADRNFTINDRRSIRRDGVSIRHLDPVMLELTYNPTSGQEDWFYTPPRMVRDGCMNGIRVFLESTEQKIMHAAMIGRKVRLDSRRLFITKTDAATNLWEGWGVPPLFRVLEDVYYYKILRRSNEALAQEHVTPMRVISPAQAGDAAPQRTMNLSDWQRFMKQEVENWRRDPNYILFSPISIHTDQVGGQARLMMVAAEQEAACRVIAAGIGCPIEMIWGGMNWSGANVTLRVLENHFLNDREDHHRFLDWLVRRLSAYYRLPRIEAELSDFKMADDVQRQAAVSNLMIQGFASRETGLGTLDMDPAEEFDRLEREHKRMNRITLQDTLDSTNMNIVVQAMTAKAQALLQFELQLLQGDIQVQADRLQQEAINGVLAKLHDRGYTAPIEFNQTAKFLAGTTPDIQNLILGTWQQTMPMVTSLLMLQMQQINPQLAPMPPQQQLPMPQQEEPQQPTPMDTGEPLPEQRPPRRQDSPV